MAKSKFTSPIARLSFPDLFRPNKQSGKYECQLLFRDADHVAPMVKIVDALIEEEWGRRPDDPKFHYPILEQERNPELGDYFVRFKSKQGPIPVCDEKKEPLGPDSSLLYPGCKARVVFTPNCYEFNGNIGVNFYLSAVQRCGDDEHLGADPLAAFTEIEVEMADDLVTTETDDLFA